MSYTFDSGVPGVQGRLARIRDFAFQFGLGA